MVNIFLICSQIQYIQRFMKVYGRGMNIAAQLNSSRKNVKYFTQIPQLTGIQIKHLDCGYLQSYYLLEDKQLLKAGYYLDSLTNVRVINLFRTFPTIFSQFQKLFFIGKTLSFRGGDQNLTLINPAVLSEQFNYTKAVFSHSSLFLLTDKKEVHCLGENYFGQLGTKNTISTEDQVKKLTNINGQKIVDVACGFQHTVFVTQKGELYGCGKADSYQIQPQKYQNSLDITTFDKIIQPTLIWDRMPVLRVACGFKNTIFQTIDNKLYALGANKYGECGYNYQKSQILYGPTQIHKPFSTKIKKLVCGFRHTLVLTEDEVYFTGSIQSNKNPYIKLNENICALTEINLGWPVRQIFAKFDRSAIVGDGKLCLFGGKDLEAYGGESGKLQIIEGFNFNKNTLVGLGYSHTIICP